MRTNDFSLTTAGADRDKIGRLKKGPRHSVRAATVLGIQNLRILCLADGAHGVTRPYCCAEYEGGRARHSVRAAFSFRDQLVMIVAQSGQEGTADLTAGQLIFPAWKAVYCNKKPTAVGNPLGNAVCQGLAHGQVHGASMENRQAPRKHQTGRGSSLRASRF